MRNADLPRAVTVVEALGAVPFLTLAARARARGDVYGESTAYAALARHVGKVAGRGQ